MDVHRQRDDAIAGGAGVALAHALHQLVGHGGGGPDQTGDPSNPAIPTATTSSNARSPPAAAATPGPSEARAQVGLIRRPAASVAMASAPLRTPRRHASGARTTGMAGKHNRDPVHHGVGGLRLDWAVSRICA